MAVDDTTTNVCVFCYETLLDGQHTVGVAVPCGHCFHEHCWSSYVASKNNNRHGYYQQHDNTPTMKCPTCQGKVKTLSKLFLDFDCITNTNEEDDLVSLSDTEDEENLDDDKEENTAKIEENPVAPQHEVIVLDDDDDDDDDNKTDKNNNSNLQKEKINKYKKMATKWKAACQRSNEVLQDLQTEKDANEDRMKRMNDILAEREREAARYQQDFAEMRTQLQGLRSDLHQKTQEARDLRTALSHREAQLTGVRSDLHKARVETDKARKNYIVEAEELLREHPVLMAKVKRLEQEKRSLQEELQRRPTNKTDNSKKNMGKSDQRKLLREVSLLREEEDATNRNHRQRVQPTNEPSKPFKTVSRVRPSAAGMDVLENQGVISTGLLLLGKKKRTIPLENRKRTNETKLKLIPSRPQKKRTTFR